LNEFANVARRKLGMGWEELAEALSSIRRLCPTAAPLHIATHEAALRIARRHGFAIFDSLMIAAALGAGCVTLWSEDMADGMSIDGRLRVRDPFKPGRVALEV
jgi:predicted nucleic acid-binding protein